MQIRKTYQNVKPELLYEEIKEFATKHGTVIQGASRNHRHCGLCGQAPSDYPEFAEFLVREGIHSMSLNADSVMKITLTVLDMERRLRS